MHYVMLLYVLIWRHHLSEDHYNDDHGFQAVHERQKLLNALCLPINIVLSDDLTFIF
jgi:hypothetical protein